MPPAQRASSPLPCRSAGSMSCTMARSPHRPVDPINTVGTGAVYNPLTADKHRLFARTDELLFQPSRDFNAAGNATMTKSQLNRPGSFSPHQAGRPRSIPSTCQESRAGRFTSSPERPSTPRAQRHSIASSRSARQSMGNPTFSSARIPGAGRTTKSAVREGFEPSERMYSRLLP